MHDERSGIFRDRQREVIQMRRRNSDRADSVLVQSVRRREVVRNSHERERLNVMWQRQISIMAHPRRNGQNIFRLEEFTDLMFQLLLSLYLRCLIGKQRKLRQIGIAHLLKSLEGN